MDLASRDISAIAERIFEAGKAEFHWEARVRKSYLGQHFSLDFGDEDGPGELSRIAILSLLAGRWHAGVCLVDGNGHAVEMLWVHSFDGYKDACDALSSAR